MLIEEIKETSIYYKIILFGISIKNSLLTAISLCELILSLQEKYGEINLYMILIALVLFSCIFKDISIGITSNYFFYTLLQSKNDKIVTQATYSIYLNFIINIIVFLLL